MSTAPGVHRGDQRFITGNMEECTTYLQEKSNAVGCRLSFDMSDRFRTLTTKLVHQNKSYVKNLNLKRIVKLYPPTNLSVEMNKDPELNLYWNNSKNNQCIESEVRYRINSNKWQSSTLRWEQKYIVNDPLKNSLYEFQVRARVNSDCGESEFWSDWSQPILWDSMKGNNITGKNLEDLLDKDNLEPNFTERVCPVREYRLVPQTGSVSESESNLSIPTDQSDSLSTCSSSTSTLPVTIRR
ncbi:unnamed protein product [Coregonus sp. 'balchen']|nr:unnamed protein product [Coregonus sp. 'balchen']